MPEGHTIHRVAEDHQAIFAGQSLAVWSPQGRFANEAEQLSGKRLVRVEAHGKHLFYVWPRKLYLHIHLGLYGKFRLHENPAPEPRGAVRIRAIGKTQTFDLNGPNRCELLNQSEYDSIIARLGEDPLRKDSEPDRVWERFSKSRSAVGKLLLDQAIIAGVGNVYRAEVLHRFQIDPERVGTDLTRDEFDKIWEQLVEWMKVGVKYNQIITTDDARRKRGRMKREERLRCYKQESCCWCGEQISRWELGARTIYACRGCQV